MQLGTDTMQAIRFMSVSDISHISLPTTSVLCHGTIFLVHAGDCMCFKFLAFTCSSSTIKWRNHVMDSLSLSLNVLYNK